MDFEDIKKYPANEVHSLFKYCDSLADIYQLQGYLGAHAETRSDRNIEQIAYS